MLRAAALLAVAVPLFLCYVALSRTVQVNSDAASNALQAWNMLHGNWLLQGWWLSDVSFYTTELPEYMVVETVRGLGPDVVHVAAALTYTLLVLGAAWLAKGRETGWAAVARMVLAGGIMLAPQTAAVQVLMLAPDHVGSAVPVLAVLLLLDRAPPRWWVPALTGLVLTAALVADNVLIVTGVLPLVAICAGRVCYSLARRKPLQSRWLELSLLGAAVSSAVLSRLILAIIAANGGFKVWPVRAELVPWSRVLTHLQIIPRGLVLLFGVTTTSHSALGIGLAWLHLAGLGLAVWGVGAALWRFRRIDLVDQVLVGAVLINLAAFIFFTPGATSYSARDYAAVLPLSAALAARMAGKQLLSVRLAPVAAAVLACYVLSLATAALSPSAPPRNERLVHWLLAHHLDYGLGGYGAGNTTTLNTGNRVHVVVVVFRYGRCYPLQWEGQASSYDARLHNATFMVQDVGSASIRRVFGTPDQVDHVGSFTVLVWHKNLLTDVQPASSQPGRGVPAQHALLPSGTFW
ncbi:MAG TPA: hypothetical protein VGS19_18330 [Streptosporangiaceae bacterium]|nr:hypothetical protein [Streptosporangiaceae bacterium]